MFNISQYVNYAFSNATGEVTNCVPGGRCQEMTCYIGRQNSSITFITLPCDTPASVKIVVTDTTGEVTYNDTITNYNRFSWAIDSGILSVDLTVQHPNSTAIALQASSVLQCNL